MSFAFALLLVVFIGAFLIRIPLAYAMMSAGIVWLLASGSDLGVLAQVTMNGFYSKWVLLAVPLFIFSAQVMNDSTVTAKIFDFAHALVGRMPGGLAQVNVVNSVIFSGMSGSAVADASGTGLVEIKAMASGGYPKDFACATTAATSTIGPIIPPSIPMVIYAYLSATSVGMLFAAGMVPGLLLAGMQMVLIRWMAQRRGFPREMWPGFGQAFGKFLVAIPALLSWGLWLSGCSFKISKLLLESSRIWIWSLGLCSSMASSWMGPSPIADQKSTARASSSKPASCTESKAPRPSTDTF